MAAVIAAGKLKFMEVAAGFGKEKPDPVVNDCAVEGGAKVKLLPGAVEVDVKLNPILPVEVVTGVAPKPPDPPPKLKDMVDSRN